MDDGRVIDKIPPQGNFFFENPTRLGAGKSPFPLAGSRSFLEFFGGIFLIFRRFLGV